MTILIPFGKSIIEMIEEEKTFRDYHFENHDLNYYKEIIEIKNNNMKNESEAKENRDLRRQN